jgi:hypothetical protein
VTPPSPFRLYRREIANAQYRNSASRLEAHRSLVERSAAATTEHRSQVIARVSAQKGEKGKWRYGEACRPGCRKAPPAMQERSRCLHTFRSSWKGRAHHVDVLGVSDRCRSGCIAVGARLGQADVAFHVSGQCRIVAPRVSGDSAALLVNAS